MYSTGPKTDMVRKIYEIEKMLQSRKLELTEDIELYFKIAGEFEKTNEIALIQRADFIRKQCNGENAEKLFDENRESWGIPKFNEDLINAGDFKRGFLFKFRDHTTSWTDNQRAKEWFLNSFEARFVQIYELWSCDNGAKKIIETRTGDYKTILKSLLADGDYEVLTSPAFSKHELDNFIKAYQPKNGDFSIEEIIEDYVNLNPNY